MISEEGLKRFRNKRSGKIYTVLCITNIDSKRSDFVPTVVYYGDDGVFWSRPVVEFLNKNDLIE